MYILVSKEMFIENTNTETILKIDSNNELLEFIKTVQSAENYQRSPFYVVDLDDICQKFVTWTKTFPRIQPHYAVKCNHDIVMLKLLARLGVNFDCASKQEIDTILGIGVTPDRIVYANPCKQDTHVKYAYDKAVNYMTFDNEDELYKIKDYHKNAKIILRIYADDSHAYHKLSKKFGAKLECAYQLIDLAVRLGLDIVGISFHVGTNNMWPYAYNEPIRNARLLFDYARKEYNVKFSVLDIGGGFLGKVDSLFDSVANEVNKSLDTYFRDCENDGVKIIAEPGTYFAYSAFTLFATVIARRVTRSSNNEKSFMYYLNDGIYMSFNYLNIDKNYKYPFTRLTGATSDDEKLYKSSLWGPTCDSVDMIEENCELPELKVNETLIYKNMGAYTASIASPFNGMLSYKFYYVASSYWDSIKAAFGF